MEKTETICQLFISALGKEWNIPAYSNALLKRVQNVILSELPFLLSQKSRGKANKPSTEEGLISQEHISRQLLY
jgi:hypothetical protein